MKRDFDLVREILLRVEEDERATGPAWINLSIAGRDHVEVSHHVQLLDEAGLLEAKNLTGLNNFEWQPIRLTWAGHEFLDAARDEERWEKAKDLTIKKAGNLSFEVLRFYLIEILRGTLG
jgi:hypothetical protein